MNWYKRAARPQMTIEEALRVFGYPSAARPSPEEIKKKYRDLARQSHPDLGHKGGNITQVNNAYEVLKTMDMTYQAPSFQYGTGPYKGKGPRTNYESGYRGPEDVPPWQTDARSSYNVVNENSKFRDINYCKREIYSYSLRNGDVLEYLVSAFDGYYFRGTFTVKTNDASLGFVGEVMEQWNSLGANPYPTEAVVAAQGHSSRWKVIRIKGSDASGRNIWIEMDDGGMPWNNRQATEQLRRILGEG